MENQIKLTDAALLNELKIRFEQNQKMLEAQKKMIRQVEDLNEKLIESEMLKGHFLSNIKNEINNPLAAILGLSNSIMSNSHDKGKVAVNSALIHKEIVNLNFQLGNIFCAAEIEAGEKSPEISNVNISALIESAIGIFEDTAKQKNIHVKFNYTTKTSFKTDAAKLHLILSNLLSNAIKFGGECSEITVKTDIDKDQLIINVIDNGVGIAEEYHAAIFDRFKQLESGTMKAYEGHGLGLSVVKSLVDILNGEIEVESVEGYGSAFTIKLPEGLPLSDDLQFSSSGNDFLFEDDDNEVIF